VVGLKEELIGKLTRNPERFRHGREMLTGEERRRKLTGAVSVLKQFLSITHKEFCFI